MLAVIVKEGTREVRGEVVLADVVRELLVVVCQVVGEEVALAYHHHEMSLHQPAWLLPPTYCEGPWRPAAS